MIWCENVVVVLVIYDFVMIEKGSLVGGGALGWLDHKKYIRKV